jgi:ketosteroid isomerase-like protein
VLAAFRAAFEARDAGRIASLFTADAAENGRHGREAIAAGYRERLEQLSEVRYAVASLAVAPRGDGIRVHAPFAITYRQPDGRRGEVHGEAEWALERREGRPVVTGLHYRLDAPPAPVAAARTASR